MSSLKNIIQNTNRIMRNFRYSNYIKFKTFQKTDEIVNLNVFKKEYFGENNDLTNIMNKHGSDKGNKTQMHNYTDFYHFLFKDIKENKLNIFEVGIGSIDENVPWNMTPVDSYKPLSSLRGWKEYFKNSNIYGADIDKKILKDEDRIQTFYVDMLNTDSITSMWRNIGIKMDVIIDDGFHRFDANINFLENSLTYLNDGGHYIIEDVRRQPRIVKKFHSYLSKSNLKFQFIDLKHNKNIFDNCLILINKN